MSEVIAIACSDIHLSHKPPVARSAEPDWYAAMERPLEEVNGLCRKYNAPLLIAGDIFDRWNSPPELINFAIRKFIAFPRVYSIPGQHDLPNHSLDEVNRSAYMSLVLARSILDISGRAGDILISTKRESGVDVYLYAYEWGAEVKPIKTLGKAALSIALIHSYIWSGGTGYKGASEESRVYSWDARLKGYSLAIFGDNHNGFHMRVGPESNALVLNCGTFMRRKSNEINYTPAVYLIRSDGDMRVHFLDTSEDKFIDDIEKAKKIEVQQQVAEDVISELQSLSSDSLDFRSSVNQYLDVNGVDEDVRKLVLESMEDG